MKLLISQAIWATLAIRAMAFPAAMWKALEGGIDPELLARATEMLEERQGATGADAATAIFEPTPIFNEKQQFVDVTAGSGHEWVAPGANDIRGKSMLDSMSLE